MEILTILFLLYAVYLSLVIASVAAKRRRPRHKMPSPAEVMEKEAERADPCDTCLRWYECNGVDRDSCPIVERRK